MEPNKKDASCQAGAPRTKTNVLQTECSTPIDLLLGRLEGVQSSGRGYRAMCPACGGKSRKVSIAEAGNGSVLLHAFCGCSPADVLGALGLQLGDLFPARLRPLTDIERREARRRIKEASWGAAIDVVDFEASVVWFAGEQLARWKPLSEEDDARLNQARDRIASAREVLRGR